MYSQYIMNGFLINPSLAGRDGYTTVNMTVREQWVGMAGAPSTYAASIQTRILKDSYISKSTVVRKKLEKPTKGGKVGIGGYVFNDNNGIMKRSGFQAAYAYHLSFGQVERQTTNYLSFGLAFTAYEFSINTKGLIYNPDDPFLNSYDRSVFIPDFSFGTSFSTPRYYIGFSMTNLLRGSLLVGDTVGKGKSEIGHYFLTGAIKFPLSENWLFEPSVLLKSSDMFSNSFQADITSRIYFKNDYWAGVSWRTNDAIIVMTGFKYDHLYFAYAVDLTLSDIRRQSYGTHEFTLAVKFGESARRYRWLNAF
jgi:type IX secretion system PorP/SprF family membrane protein